MPINTHLQWFEMKEFGGLWTAGAQSLMPANKAAIMSGCHPQVGGGLRAFLKPTSTVPDTGLDLHHSVARPVGYGVSVKAGPDGVSAPTHLVMTAAETIYLRVPGTASSRSTTPDVAAFDITGDITVQFHVAADDWTTGANQTVLSNLAGNTGYGIAINGTGGITFSWGDGAATNTKASTVDAGFPDGAAFWMRATLDVDNGAAGNDVKFYTSQDGETWTQLGATVTTAGVTSIGASSTQMALGANPANSSRFTGDILNVQVSAGLPGAFTSTPLLIVASGEAVTAGGGTFTDDAGNVWTLGADAEIIDDPTLLRDWQLWRWETDAGSAAWVNSLESQGADFAGGGSKYTTPLPAQPQFARFKSGAFATDIVGLAIREDTSAPYSAVYELDIETGDMDFYDGGIALVLSGYGVNSAVEHQSRVVVATRDLVAFSAPGDATFTTAGGGFVILNKEGWLHETTGEIREGALIAWMLSVPPGDFLAATRDGKVYNVQGDLADPIVRELGRWTTMLPHEPAATPNGVFFILPNTGIVTLGLDGSVTPISHDILPSIWNPSVPYTGLGQIAATERFLFCPNQHQSADHSNGPLVFDVDTKAWFTATHPDDYTITNPRFMQADNNPRDSGIWVMGAGTVPMSEDLLYHYRTGGYDEASLTTEVRNSAWVWKSAPLREPNGRHIDIREVQIPVHAFNTSVSTLTVTVGNTTHVRTLGSGRNVETFLFRERGEYLDIQVYAESNDADVEAPMLESVRVGHKPGPMRPQP